jgi:hypothetical protein
MRRTNVAALRKEARGVVLAPSLPNGVSLHAPPPYCSLIILMTYSISQKRRIDAVLEVTMMEDRCGLTA